jgi:uncharacterized protein
MSRQQRRLPHQIDPFRLAEAGAQLNGNLPLRQFQRLRQILADDSGEIAVNLDFEVDELGVPIVLGSVSSNLILTCQRCLGEFAFPVDVEIALAWVKTTQEADKLPLRYEPYVVEETPLLLNDVIEDELLLALPQIPMHEEAECSASKLVKRANKVTNEPEQKGNPFSVLAKLKSEK